MVFRYVGYAIVAETAVPCLIEQTVLLTLRVQSTLKERGLVAQLSLNLVANRHGVRRKMTKVARFRALTALVCPSCACA